AARGVGGHGATEHRLCPARGAMGRGHRAAIGRRAHDAEVARPGAPVPGHLGEPLSDDRGASMKLGLAIKNFVGPSEQPDMDALYAYAQRAEALGFESLWAWDHVILGVEPAFPILDAVGTLTAIAAATIRI